MADPDVVVVGAGAGGLAAAWRLTSQGARVVLLEAGRRFEPDEDYPQTEPDFELRSFPYDPVADEAGRPRYGFGPAQPVGPEWDGYRSWNRGQGRFAPGPARRAMQYSHVRGVGGSTLHFQGEAHRFHPASLQMASRFGAGADWPIPYAELERYYDLVEARVGVAGPADLPQRPRATAPPLPAHPLSWASRRLAPAFAEVGLTLVPNHLAILSRGYDRRPPCNYCDSCTQGCPIGDKGSADVTFLPAALATGRLDLRPECQALRVETDRSGRAAGVVYADAAGRVQRVRARFVVLAGGAVETPRLLLLSESRHFPRGLANGDGQVGRNLTESLFWTGVGLLGERVDSWRGVPIDGSAWERAVPRAGNGWAGGFRLATAHGAAGLRGPAAYATRLVEGFGRSHQRRMREVFGRAVAVLAVGEWLPGARTRVTLDPRRGDARSLPVARITTWLGDGERRLLREMADTVRAILNAAGAEIVEEASALDLVAPTHVLGTCRMGMDPAASVADRDGFAHEVPNLAFADGSLLPSSGAGDSPFLTISALAVRTADRVLERART